ncbi:MAG: lytic transglycosylase domain-containing protein [Candidatus Sericytochromatia bacterium]|nr:lytic transglycosylase domain-containing protein [Candidatus Sericytochromatia bacterium]
MNPGLSAALAAIDRIQHRMQELESRHQPRATRETGFREVVARAGGEARPAQPPQAAWPGGLGPLGPGDAAPAAGGSAAYRPMIAAAASRHGLDPALVQAVVAAESGGNPEAKSPAGAMGLMQLMPGTARALGVADPYDPSQNVEAGTRYLADMTRRFGLEKGIAAYNAGPGAVARHDGVPPYRETKAYVQKVLRLYGQFSEERS